MSKPCRSGLRSDALGTTGAAALRRPWTALVRDHAWWPFRGRWGDGGAGPILHGGRVYLRWPCQGDHPAWAGLRAASRDFLAPWEPSWPEDALTPAAFARRLRAHREDARKGAGFMFLVFRVGDDALLGGVTLSQVRRGAAASAEVGYWLGREHGGQGYMTEAMEAVLGHVFQGLRLNRLEAACLPENQRSKALLARLGFRQEGLLRAYLRINGRWCDHELHALLAEEWSGRSAGVPLPGPPGADGRDGPQACPALAER